MDYTNNAPFWMARCRLSPLLSVLISRLNNVTDKSLPAFYGFVCSGQLKLATALEFFQYRFSDSFGGNPPLYSCSQRSVIFLTSFSVLIRCSFFFNSRISICSGVMGDAFGDLPCRSSRHCLTQRVVVDRPRI